MKRTLLAITVSLALLPAVHAERNYRAWSMLNADVGSDSNTTYRSVATKVDNQGNVVVTGYNDLLQKDTWVTERYDALTGTRIWRQTLASTTGEARPAAIGTDSAGDVYVGGFIDVLGKGTDFCLVKYRATDGVELWRKTYNNTGTDGNDQIIDLAVSSSNLIAVTGTSMKSGSNEDFYTILYDAAGAVKWEKRHSTSFLDRPSALAFAPDGDVVVVGKSRVFYLTCYCMIRHDAVDGTIVREENYDGTSDDEATDVAVDTDGNIYVTGLVHNQATFDYTVKTIKYGTSGTWEVNYNAPDQALNTRSWWPRIGVGPDSNPVMACTSKQDGFKTVFYAAKYATGSSGILWQTTMTAPAGSPSNYMMTDMVQELEVDSTGAAIVTGSTYKTSTHKDFLTVKFNGTDGRILWQQITGGPSTSGEDTASSVALSPLGDVIVTGTVDRGDQNSYYQMATIRYNRFQLSKGDPITGTGLSPAAVVNSLSVPATRSNGSILARITVKDGSKVLNAIMENHLGNRALALQGQIAGQLLGAKFATFSDPVCTTSGNYSFIATMTGTATGQNTGLFTNAFSSEPQLALQTGKQVPGMNTGILLASIVNINHINGQIIAHITVKGTGVTTANNNVVLHVKNLTQAAALMRTGTDVTVFGKSTKVKALSIFSPPAGATGHGRYTGAGKVIMTLTFTDARSAATIVDTVTLTPTFLAGTGSSGPQNLTTATYHSVTTPGINIVGTYPVAKATLKPGTASVTTANDSLLVWAANIGNNFSILAREGSPAPSSGSAVHATFGTPISNSTGTLAFIGTIKGSGITSANDSVLWFGTPANLMPLVNEGLSTPDAFGNLTSRKFSSFTNIALPAASVSIVFRAKVKGTGITTANNDALFALDSEGYLREMIRTGNKLGSLTVKSFTLLNSTAKTMNSTRSLTPQNTLTALITFTNSTQSIISLDVP